MSLWNRLFGRTPTQDASVRELAGVLTAIPRSDVSSLDTTNLASVIEGVRRLTLASRRLHVIELSIDGYGDDPRELFEILEVVEWVKHARKQHEDLTFWLAPGALRIVLLCSLPGTWCRKADGRIEAEFSPKEVAEHLMMANVTAVMALAADGLPTDVTPAIAQEAARNVQDAMHGRSFGHGYIVSFTQGAA